MFLEKIYSASTKSSEGLKAGRMGRGLRSSGCGACVLF